MRRIVLSLVVVLAFAGVAHAQDGQIFGRVTDRSGALLPGVTVTLSGSALLEPEVTTTSGSGTYQFPRLAIGLYTVTFELVGFQKRVHNDIRMEIRFNAQINAQLDVATIEESVQVIGASPVIDVRSATQGMQMNLEALQSLPSARDIFHIVEMAPGIAVDRQNVGGSTSGQQTNFISRGAPQNQTKWIIDGVEVSDTGNGTAYYTDFDAFEEMQIATGGSDVTVQTPGAQINIVSKSGSDRFHGSAKTFITDKSMATTNMSDELRRGGASAGGNPVLNIKDYGGEMGGPIKRGRAWFWGAYGAQDVQVGVENFFLKTTECAAVASSPLSHSTADVRDCLTPAPTYQDHINYKIAVQPFRGNQLSVRMGFDKKLERYRGANDLIAPEAADNIFPTMGKEFGALGWNRGWPPTHKFADQQTFSDRWLVDFSVTHFNKDTTITFDTPELATVQQAFEIGSGHTARSGSHSAKTLPYDTMNVTTNYFLPGTWGGDHSVKAGFRWGRDRNYNEAAQGGGAIARFNSAANLPRFTTPFSARFYRESLIDERRHYQAAYIQDTFTRNRLTVNLGIRWDRQDDRLVGVDVPASQFQGQRDINGNVFNLLPAVTFPGAEGGTVWNDFAPRVSMTYDVAGNGKTVLKGAYALYFNQRNLAELARTYNTIGSSFVELPWQDLNGDKFVQANEVNTGQVISFGGQYNPADPAQTVSPNRVDPNIRNPRTDEIVLGISRELAANLGVSVSYVWRKYTDLVWQDRVGLTSANYAPVTFTPAASACPAAARCETVTYFVPNIPVPATYVYSNQPDHHRRYQGLEAVARKRLSDRWMMSASFAYNDTTVFYNSPDAYEDPTNIDKYDGAQFAPESTGSNGGNVFLNSKWIARFSGSYRLAWQEIGLAASYDSRQGYPYPASINISSRPNSAGAIQVLLDPLGEERLPTFQTLDFKVDKLFAFRGVKVQTALDIFNVFNGSTILARRRNQNASNAGLVNLILAPRIARFGLTVNF